MQGCQIVSQEQATQRSIGSFLETVLDGAVGPLVAYLADRKGLSKKQIRELERMLDEKDQGKS